MTARVFTWDHREQPPLADIAALVDELTNGKVTMRALDTASDQYAWLIADKGVRPSELRRIAAAEGITL